MRRLISLTVAFAVALAASVFIAGAASAATVTCMPTGFFRDGINMTAAQIGGNVTGPLNAADTIDAIPCNIGVYYDANSPSGSVSSGADISGASYFGVVVRGTAVNVTNASVHDIGDVPLSGSQHGTAIYYATVDNGSATAQAACTTGSTTGTISGNTVDNYQKSGIVANCLGTNVKITNNTVNGEGPVLYIAQNGIQVGYGAMATVTGNTVTGNAYTGPNGASSAGMLVVGGACFGLPTTTGLTITKNTLTGNDVGVWLFNADSSCNAVTGKTNNVVKFNTISNGAVTNTTGYSATCGYQAGVSDVGHKDQIVNNTIFGAGYTPISGDCLGTPPAFVRSVDADSSARGVGSNK